MNPKYNDALGEANQSGEPPFDLSKVVMRIFPLRANFHSLQLFCDRYVNIAPEYSHVEPAAPYVLFCVINYGRMGNLASNFGYTSQNEVLFSVPLNWYRKQRGSHGSWALQKSSSISPFIWVDQPSSAWTGRDVFGWPKSIAWLKPGLNEWTKDPTAPRTLFSLEALIYRRMFAAERQEPSLLLEIDQEQPSALLKAPPDPMNALNPWLAWPKGVLRSLSVGGSLLETMTRLPAFGFPQWGDGANILEMMRSMFGDYNPIRSLPASNTLNLKQFRHPSYPQSVSYQAIVNSKMTPKSFTRGGMLGEQGLLRGDLAGGYRIRIHRHPAWPIIESLGLEVSHEYEEQGHSVAVLEPVIPFWVDVDFEYGKGEVICWRTHDTHWKPPPAHNGDAKAHQDAEAKVEGRDEERCGKCAESREVETRCQERCGEGAESREVETRCQERCGEGAESREVETRCQECGSPHLYNTAEGSAVEQVYGPFTFPNATVRVLPLMADWNKLRKFTDAYLNFPEGKGRPDPPDFPEGRGPAETRVDDQGDLLIGEKGPATLRTPSDHLFVPWGRYVYMTVTNYEEITSELNVGWWARRRVTFSYPVKWYKWEAEGEGSEDGHWALKSFGVVSPFMYVDTSTAATVGREMNGWCVAEAEIECPKTDWLLGAGGSNAVDLMALSTDVVPALNANQKTEHGLLLEVTTRDPLDRDNTEGWKEIAALWGERQVIEAAAKAKEARPIGGGDPGWPPRRRLKWLKSTAMEILFRGLPINHIALKQFRDAEDPTRACLQTLNVYPESISRIHDLRPIDNTLHVAVHRYPTAPIVDLLGLDVKWTDNSKGQPIDYLQAIRPFWMRADLKAELGRDVVFRAGSDAWCPSNRKAETTKLYFEDGKKLATPTLTSELADKKTKEVQDFGTERFFMECVELQKKTWKEWEWSITRGGHLAQLKEARLSFAPQVAIESILNHGWVNFDPEFESGMEQKVALIEAELESSNPDASESDIKREAASLVQWRTLIPKSSIPNEVARKEFLKNYGYRDKPAPAFEFESVQHSLRQLRGLLKLEDESLPDAATLRELQAWLEEQMEKKEKEWESRFDLYRSKYAPWLTGPTWPTENLRRDPSWVKDVWEALEKEEASKARYARIQRDLDATLWLKVISQVKGDADWWIHPEDLRVGSSDNRKESAVSFLSKAKAEEAAAAKKAAATEEQSDENG